MAKETFYFTHDYNARTDSKIKLLIRDMGMQGYGIYWSIIEDLYNNANALPLDCDSISFDLRVKSDKVKKVIEGYGLFVVEGEIFGSLSVQKRLEERNEKSKTARVTALKRWGKDANGMPLHSEGNAIKESKVKKKKVKESKVIPTEFDFLNYCKELLKEKYGPLEFALKEKLKAWVQNGWKDGNEKEIKNWKTKIGNVIPYLKPMGSTAPKIELKPSENLDEGIDEWNRTKTS
jgi:hypothetical protein